MSAPEDHYLPEEIPGHVPPKTKASDMTLDQKADALALNALMQRVMASPGGRQFVVDLFLLNLKKSGLAVINKSELAELRGKAAGTIEPGKP